MYMVATKAPRGQLWQNLKGDPLTHFKWSIVIVFREYLYPIFCTSRCLRLLVIYWKSFDDISTYKWVELNTLDCTFLPLSSPLRNCKPTNPSECLSFWPLCIVNMQYNKIYLMLHRTSSFPHWLPPFTVIPQLALSMVTGSTQ